MQKKTKIIATIGPASHNKETLVQMIKAGMDVARLNFSHGSYASHATLIKHIRSASEKLHKPVGILQDLSGPKLRLGEFSARGGSAFGGKDSYLKKGQHVVFGQHGIPVGQPIWQWIKPGQVILIDDGAVEVVATQIYEDGFEGKVTFPGVIKSHKGISLPGVAIHLPALSEKDLADLEFGLKMGVDFIGLSFVKTSFDVAHLRQKIRNLTKREVPIIAKIETPEALRNIDKIILASDAIMIGRGDLALNINQSLVPIAQKNIVKRCLHYGKPVIVATQMLESMIHNPRPTRAEISDVANAVLDHVDCVMLSGETAFGTYPVKTIEIMANIIAQTENSSLDKYYHPKSEEHAVDKEHALVHTLLHVGMHSKISALVVSDIKMAAGLSHFRPGFTIVLAAKNEIQARRASLLWGVQGLVTKASVHSMLRSHGLASTGDRVMDATNTGKDAKIELVG